MTKPSISFKTSINCQNCLKKVTPTLDALAGPGNWTVDTLDPEKKLEVFVPDMNPDEVVNCLAAIGFKAEPQKE